jgi:hypothetical protein
MNEIDKILDTQRAWLAASTDDDTAISRMASVSLTKCAQAIAVLSENLREIGYPWAVSEQTPNDVLVRNVALIEKTTGLPIPKILVTYWEKVGGVSFVDLDNYEHGDFWKEHKIFSPTGFCDGLYVAACDAGWADYVCNDWKELYDFGERGGFQLELSPDGYHKDNISGGAPYGVILGNSWKPIWQNFEWTGLQRPITAPAGSPDFLSYLRTTVLECAGFPAFLGIPAFDQIKRRLLQDVPIF